MWQIVLGSLTERSIGTSLTGKALLEGLAGETDAVFTESVNMKVPQSFDDYEKILHQTFKVFGEMQEVLRPLILAALTIGFRSSSSIERDKVTRELINTMAPDLSEQERKEGVALIRFIVSSTTWMILTTQMKLTSEEAANVALRGLNLVRKDLVRRNNAAKKRGK